MSPWHTFRGSNSWLAVKELLIEGGELAEGFYNFTVPSRHNEMHEIEMNVKFS